MGFNQCSMHFPYCRSDAPASAIGFARCPTHIRPAHAVKSRAASRRFFLAASALLVSFEGTVANFPNFKRSPGFQQRLIVQATSVRWIWATKFLCLGAKRRD